MTRIDERVKRLSMFIGDGFWRRGWTFVRSQRGRIVRLLSE